jgi:hypothetical protein
MPKMPGTTSSESLPVEHWFISVAMRSYALQAVEKISVSVVLVSFHVYK